MVTIMRAESEESLARDPGTAAGAPEAEADERDAGVEELARAADVLFYAMRRGRAATAQSASGLSPAQLALIDPLDRDAELPVSRLAAGAAISVPTATRMLQQMEAKGLVSRRRSPADERQVLVSLTDEGLGELRLLRARLRERQARALMQFAPEERWELARQLRKLAEVIIAVDH
jgi:DNA-binding MarR family transcriptional regulator